MQSKVELINHMGSDLTVVNAARVSFDKESNWDFGPPEEMVEYYDDGSMSRAISICYPEQDLHLKDQKLIQYLADNNHWSPFAHCFAQFRITAPIFVARQLVKHQVGLAWNEVSRRYVDSEPEFFIPEGWRLRAENVKQGSSEEVLVTMSSTTGCISERPSFLDDVEPDSFKDWGSCGQCGDSITTYDYKVQDIVNYSVNLSAEVYNLLLGYGICPEQARMVLPQLMMTQWYWSGSLFAFARVCKLRLDSHAQKETQEIAKGIDSFMKNLFPHSWRALVGE